MPRRILLLTLCLGVSSLLLAAGASAKTVELHTFATSFNGSDANGAPAFEPGTLDKIGVESDGEVIVAGNSAIYKFDAAGASQPFSALTPATVITPGIGNFIGAMAVDDSGGATQGRIYAFPEFGDLNAYQPSGAAVATGFPVPAGGDSCGVAVDASGNVWHHVFARGIQEYDPSGNPVGEEIELSGNGSFCQFEFDDQGNLYASSSYSGGSVSKYAPDGSLLQKIDGGSSARDVAVDRSTGDIYVDTQSTINHYGPGGEFVESFGTLNESNGVAVNPTTHAVYALDNDSPASVQEFTPTGTVSVAAATSEAPTEVTRTGATAHGKLNPEGPATTGCRFEYGTVASGSFSQSVPCAEGEVFSGSTEPSVSAKIEDGEAETEYQYRLRVTNGNGASYGVVQSFKTFGAVKGTETGEATEIDSSHATLNGSFDPDGIDTHYWFEYGTNFNFQFKAPLPVPPGADAGSTSGTIPVSVVVSNLQASTSAQGNQFQYRLVAENETGRTNGEILTFHTPPFVSGVTTLAATDLTLTRATLHGSFEPGGEDTHYYFEYGSTASYGKFAPAGPPGADGGESTGVVMVSAPVTGLEAASTVHYRIVAVNSQGTTVGGDETAKLGEAPLISGDRATEINTDTAVLEARINPAGREAKYHWEYGPEDCATTTCQQTAPTSIPTGATGVPVRYVFEGLSPGTVYHFRLVASNKLGTTTGNDHSFLTYSAESGADNCPNVLERKQTGASATRHCRAYELVSAPDTNGYDVESNLISGLHPMPGFPNADGKVLYTLRFGVVPGSGNPPNKGGDPYVATRGENGWTTEYVGLQANGTDSTKPFASSLLEADQHLDSFAFGGPAFCEPCYPDGSQNIPLRLADGSFVKGMAGSENPAANPAGAIAKRFSGDGGSFVFGSTSRFEPTGNEGSLTIYERNLGAGTTHVVSTNPDGSTMSGSGITELGVSEDGSRVLIGREVGRDADGNPEYDLYMHVGEDPHSVPVVTAAEGALDAGMTADGSKVYFSSAAQRAGDSDSGADLFRADVTASTATMERVSTGSGGSGDTDACNPVANADGNHWNQPGGSSAATCGVVAVGGGGGVASNSGTVYFFSPEKLDLASAAVPDQPNLYRAAPGSAPEFVATLDPANPAVRDAVTAAGQRKTADFQTTPDGRFAVFANATALTENTTAGHSEIYRSKVGGGLECVSCLPSNGAPTTETVLTEGGLNLVDDGRVFFTSSEQLVLRDTNQLEDAYEWDERQTALISTGLDTNDSGMLTASADGRDAFFFTRQSLAPQDENGGAMKIYDAREEGGFLYNPPPRPCVASDECHGPGSQQAAPPAINTIEGTGEPQPAIGGKKPKAKGCAKGKVKRHGKCVKAHKNHKKHASRGKRHGRVKERHHG